ncbi:MAG: hypothetical protein ACKOXO_08165 [Cyanobium sp.]
MPSTHCSRCRVNSSDSDSRHHPAQDALPGERATVAHTLAERPWQRYGACNGSHPCLPGDHGPKP